MNDSRCHRRPVLAWANREPLKIERIIDAECTSKTRVPREGNSVEDGGNRISCHRWRRSRGSSSYFFDRLEMEDALRADLEDCVQTTYTESCRG